MEIKRFELDQCFAFLVCAVGVKMLDIAEFVQVPEEGEILQDDVDLVDIHVVLIVLVDGPVYLLGWFLATAEQRLNLIHFILFPGKEHVRNHTAVFSFCLDPLSKFL